MTPPPGHIRPDGRGGLSVTVEEVEHWLAPVCAHELLIGGDMTFLYDPDPAPVLRGELRKRTGQITPSRDDGYEIPHLLITVYPDRTYMARKDEVLNILRGRLDICKVVGVTASEVEV